MSQELDKMKNQIVEQAAEALAELFVIQLDNISGVATAKEVDKL